MQSIKGKEIRFCRGKYSGYTGWENKAKKATKRYVYVIVAKETQEIQTRVKKNSIRDKWSQAQSFEEAALQQHPDMEQTMIKLAQMFAECDIYDNDEALRLFSCELDLARIYQQEAGSKARYRHVVFSEDDSLSISTQEG